MKTYRFEKTYINDIFYMIKEHSNVLSSPWDSFMEENLLKNETCMICDNDVTVGYASINKDNLFSFYVTKSHYKYAPDILADFVKAFNIKEVQALTNDPLSTGLLMEWEHEIKDRGACFFSDGGRLMKPEIKAKNPLFREAITSDIENIILHTGDFFDKLEERIGERTIFILQDGNELMGCGIVEIGKIHVDCVSIGMITCKEHRKKGVAQMILWNLKEWAYEHSLRPIAGCWYYNVLSRKSLEASGMIASGKGYTATLIEKRILALRTGNPPGEPV